MWWKENQSECRRKRLACWSPCIRKLALQVCRLFPLTSEPCKPALGWHHQTPKHFVLPLCIDRSLSYGPVIYRQESSMAKPTDLVQGTLDLLILKTLALQPMHGWGIAQRIRQVSREVLQVNQGALYPALHRLEQQGWVRAKWGESENNRRAKYYSLTPDGAKYLRQEQAQWKRLSSAIGLVLEISS